MASLHGSSAEAKAPSATGAWTPDASTRLTYRATLLGGRVGTVTASLGAVEKTAQGRRVRRLHVKATGSRAFDAVLKIRAELQSVVDADTLEPLTSRYDAVRGAKSWTALFEFFDGRVGIDTVYAKRRWRRWRWVEARAHDPLSWMLPLMRKPLRAGESRTMAVVTRRRYLTMTAKAGRKGRISTPLGRFPALSTNATFERWFPRAQLAHGRPPTKRKKPSMTARVFWGLDGLRLPLKIELTLAKVGRVTLEVIEKTSLP